MKEVRKIKNTMEKEVESVVKQVIKAVCLNTSSIDKNSAIELCQDLDEINTSIAIRGYIDELIIQLAQQYDFCPICFDNYEWVTVDERHFELDDKPIEELVYKMCKTCGYEN